MSRGYAVAGVCAKGEDYEAQLIREAAEQAGVPIMRNVELARGCMRMWGWMSTYGRILPGCGGVVAVGWESVRRRG